MNIRSFVAIASLAAVVLPMSAQDRRRATFRGGGRPGEGKCTIEVVVDGAAEVEIRGDTAVLRNLQGQTPQWRRFECTDPMPPNPVNFRFEGVDGRGRQTLMRDPRNGGAAVVRLEDPDGGREGYKFDLMWGGGGGGFQGQPGFGGDRDFGRDRDRDRGDRDRFGRDDRDRGDDDRLYRERDEFFRGGDWRQRIFERVRIDVEHVRSHTFPFGGDQYRLASTIQELNEMQDKLSRGFYDRRELDDVIGALARVVRDNRLSRRDGDILNDDLNRLRDFRARYRDYGVR